MRFARTAALATALAALLVPATATAHAAPTTDTAGRAAGRAVTLPVRDVLAALPVRDQDRTGYERTAFRHWVDADKDGCNTRAEVLKAVTGPEEGPRCTLTGGEWYSPYDDCYSRARAAWTSTIWSRSPSPGTPAPPPGRRRSGRPTPTIWVTSGR
ncbi:hypothetical protein [Streptomyces eurythermus]|uniref:hypothetical protein n=1 Tax=Streptomyces eurythermus TaxID=42237 RepID=UPI003F4D478B